MVLRMQGKTLKEVKRRLNKWQGPGKAKCYKFTRGAKHRFKMKKGFTYNWTLVSKKRKKRR